jgi:hypothetical protein
VVVLHARHPGTILHRRFPAGKLLSQGKRTCPASSATPEKTCWFTILAQSQSDH